MTLFFIAYNDENGENLDMFVRADTPEEAIKLWSKDLWNVTGAGPRPDRVFICPDVQGETEVVLWSSLEKIRL